MFSVFDISLLVISVIVINSTFSLLVHFKVFLSLTSPLGLFFFVQNCDSYFSAAVSFSYSTAIESCVLSVGITQIGSFTFKELFTRIRKPQVSLSFERTTLPVILGFLLRFRYPKPPHVVVVGLISIITLSFILSALFSPVFPIILPPETFTVISLHANIPDPPSLAVLPLIFPPSTISKLGFELPPHIHIAPPR